MKKILSILAFLFITPMLTACELSNTDLANSLEGNMTRLVYSVGYLDSITTEELSSLVNNSSYFTHSSLYNANAPATISNTDESTTTQNATTSATALEGELKTQNKTLSVSAKPYRSRTYTTPLFTNTTATNDQDGITSNVGVVDMNLLENCSTDLNNILLEISSKRGIIMLYCTDLRSGRATLSATDKKAISEYDDIIQETTNYLNNTTGALLNQFNGITSISNTENTAELINAKLIRANEVLKTRYAKLDTCLDSLDAIINILVNNIGYEYATMYNNQSINNINIPKSISNDTAPETTTISEETTSSTTNDITTNNTTTLNQNSVCCPYCKQTNCTCNNTTNICPICKKEQCTCKRSISTNEITNDTPDNTIINYYEGQNTSNILPSNASTYPINRDATATQPINNTIDNELSKTEIALNGGLIKNVNNEKITSKNANNFLSASSTTPAGALTKDHKTDPKLHSSSHPYKTLEETSNNFPIVDDLRDDEYVESEKELTPEILPFSGVSNNSNINNYSLRNSRIGKILPFQYEEDNVLRKLPKK